MILFSDFWNSGFLNPLSPKASRAKIFWRNISKKYDNLYPQVCSLLNLWQGFEKASKGRRSRPSVAGFEYELEKALVALRDKLEQETCQPGGYCNFPIHEPKRRFLLAAGLELDKVRLYLRLAHTRKLANHEQYLFAAASLTEIGKLLGGWLKTVSPKPASSAG